MAGGRSVRYSQIALATLRRLDKKTATKLRDKIELLAAQPDSLANNIKALKGNAKLMRLRVGDWRVIYTETLVVLDVIRIAHRSKAYD